MYYLIIEAAPVSPDEALQGAKGAFVSCWIDFKSKEGAIVLAEHAIRESGWTPVRVDEAFIVQRDDYLGDEEHLELFDEAVNDGASFVFNLWGEEEENDGDAIHSGLQH